jgi:hypothetical protein
MLYPLLGRLAWKAAKYVLRRRFGQTRLPRRALGIAGATAVAGAAAVLQRRRR